MKKNIRSLILFCLLMLSGLVATAQPDLPEDVPIDGGASILAAAGLAYGAKKIIDKRKENKTED